MPRFISNQSETIDLHAPWWSDKQIDSSTPIKTRTMHKNDDGETAWDEETSTKRFVEHCTVKAHMTEQIQQRVSVRVYQKYKPKPNAPISPERMAKTRLYTFLEMIIEITDEHGNPVALSEAELGKLDKRDADFIEQALNDINEPVVPILEEDEITAEQYSNDEILAESEPEMTTREGVAKRSFRSSRQTVAAR